MNQRHTRTQNWISRSVTTIAKYTVDFQAQPTLVPLVVDLYNKLYTKLQQIEPVEFVPKSLLCRPTV